MDLDRLLKDADAEVRPAVLPLAEDLACAARHGVAAAETAARIRAVALSGCAVIILLVVGVGVLRQISGSDRHYSAPGGSAVAGASAGSHGSLSPTTPETLRTRLAVLSTEADDRLATVDSLDRRAKRASRRAEVERELRLPNAIETIGQARERAAVTLLIDARRAELAPESGSDRSSIRRSYQRVIDLFPETSAARVARTSLDRESGSTGSHDTNRALGIVRATA